jgi:broad-specificity NMP kinase
MKHRRLRCDDCDSYTLHKVEENPTAKIMNIICIECNKTMTYQILHKKVKVEKTMWDEYIRQIKQNKIKVEKWFYDKYVRC